MSTFGGIYFLKCLFEGIVHCSTDILWKSFIPLRSSWGQVLPPPSQLSALDAEVHCETWENWMEAYPAFAEAHVRLEGTGCIAISNCWGWHFLSKPHGDIEREIQQKVNPFSLFLPIKYKLTNKSMSSIDYLHCRVTCFHIAAEIPITHMEFLAFKRER